MTIKPHAILRQDSYDDLVSAINKLFVGKSNFTHIYQNCLNCKFWNYGGDKCGKFNAKPPAEIIIYSCEAYEDNGCIPY
jgi:hypothetical protein